jgi:hypothetical protein
VRSLGKTEPRRRGTTIVIFQKRLRLDRPSQPLLATHYTISVYSTSQVAWQLVLEMKMITISTKNRSLRIALQLLFTRTLIEKPERVT